MSERDGERGGEREGRGEEDRGRLNTPSRKPSASIQVLVQLLMVQLMGNGDIVRHIGCGRGATVPRCVLTRLPPQYCWTGDRYYQVLLRRRYKARTGLVISQ